MHTKRTHTLKCDKPCPNGSETKRDSYLQQQQGLCCLFGFLFFSLHFLLVSLLLSQSLLQPLLLLLLAWSWSVMASVLLSLLLSLLLLQLLLLSLVSWLAPQKPRNCVVAAAAFSACPAQAKSSKSGFVRKLHCLRRRRAQQEGDEKRERERGHGEGAGGGAQDWDRNHVS